MALQHLDEQDYRALPHLNQSILKHGLRSMLHMKNAMEAPSKTTDALIFGQLVHTLVLNPMCMPSSLLLPQRLIAELKQASRSGKIFSLSTTTASQSRRLTTTEPAT